MRYILLLISLIITKDFFAFDHVDASEYMDPENRDNDSFSLMPFLVVAAVIYAGYSLRSFFWEYKGKITDFEKAVVVVCSVCILFLAIGFFKVPYVYFIFLRYIISLGALLCFVYELKNSTDHHWKIYFIIILIFHNPIYPIHLYYKTAWMIIDFLFAIMFFGKISVIADKGKQ